MFKLVFCWYNVLMKIIKFFSLSLLTVFDLKSLLPGIRIVYLLVSKL